MKVSDLITLLDAENLTPSLSGDREVSCGYACDLLSWVMSKAKENINVRASDTSVKNIAAKRS